MLSWLQLWSGTGLPLPTTSQTAHVAEAERSPASSFRSGSTAATTTAVLLGTLAVALSVHGAQLLRGLRGELRRISENITLYEVR